MFTNRCLILLMLACGLVVGEEYSIVLDPAEKFNVSWSFEDTTPSSYITFTITCRTTGWVGLGFSPNGGMANADIIMAWVADDGTANIMDMYATSNGAPVKDVSQDVELISATETNGVSSVTFRRKLHTCDKEGDNQIMSSTTRLIYAYNDADPVDADSLSGADRHSHRGVKSVYLLEPKTTNVQPPSDAKTIDLTVSNYSVPSSSDTTYYCKFFDGPQLDSKHHIISFEALVQEGNEGVVHHAVLYGCHGVSEEHMRNNNKTEGVCYTDEMPEFFYSCLNVIYAWAVGGGTFYYPEEAGYPIGGANGSEPEYYMLEMHYDNPGYLDTWVDSSGLRLTYTPTLRNEDVGYLLTGSVAGIAVPPQPDSFRAVGYCDSSCTKQWIPEGGVQIFSYLLHAHLLGVAIEVDWYREGKHIGVLAKDDHYDFNFQESRHYKENKRMMPGDTLKITCTYTDLTRANVTYGDLPSSSEMCLAFFSYYPKQPVVSCSSYTGMLYNEDDPIYEALSVNATFGGEYANQRVLSEVTQWTNDAVAALQDAYDVTNHYSECSITSDQSYEISRQSISPADYPNVTVEENDDICDEDNAVYSGAPNVGVFSFLVLSIMTLVAFYETS